MPISEPAPGIFRITQALGPKPFKSSVNFYVIAGRDGLVFDSGYGRPGALKLLASAIPQVSTTMAARGECCTVTRAMISHGHWDHFSGLWFLQEHLDLEILATRRQAFKIGSKENYKHFFWEKRTHRPGSPCLAPFYKVRNHLLNEIFLRLFSVGFVSGRIRPLDEKGRLRISGETWQIIPVPGHSDDDIALYNPARGILLSGDMILRTVTTWLGPPKSNLALYLNSLERLKNLQGLRLILPAHGSPITDPQTRLQAAIDHRNRRTAQVLEIIAGAGTRGLSFQGIYHRIYPGRRLGRALLGGWITVTLKHLLEQGDILAVPDGPKTLFRPVL